VVEFLYPALGVLVTLAVEVMLMLILMLENDVGDAVRQLAGQAGLHGGGLPPTES
jgi:hypothetical protein